MPTLLVKNIHTLVTRGNKKREIKFSANSYQFSAISPAKLTSSRDEIAEDAQVSLAEFKAGKIKLQSASDAIAELQEFNLHSCFLR